MDRRGFLSWLGLGTIGAVSTLTPTPGSILDLSRDPIHRERQRLRATDEPQPRQDYGLQIKVDSFIPNPDPNRRYSFGNATDRAGDTWLYLRGWIDEEVYGLQDEEVRRVFSQALATCLMNVKMDMEPLMADLRLRAWDRKHKWKRIETIE